MVFTGNGELGTFTFCQCESFLAFVSVHPGYSLLGSLGRSGLGSLLQLWFTTSSTAWRSNGSRAGDLKNQQDGEPQIIPPVVFTVQSNESVHSSQLAKCLPNPPRKP